MMPAEWAAARGDLDRLAAQRERLARQARADSLGLRRVRACATWRGTSACASSWPTTRSRPRRDETLELVGAAANWDVVRVATNRSWTRDTGPLFVVRDGEKRATHWRFNAWAKYDDWQLDVAVAPAIAHAAGVPSARVEAHGSHVVLEGGAVDVDGEGTLLATEECLLDRVQARNPELSREQMERVLATELGAERVVNGSGKRHRRRRHAHGHIDDLARFVAPGRVVVLCQRARRAATRTIAAVAENRRAAAVERAMRAEGRASSRSCALPMPRARSAFEGRRLPASYANFYIANDVVLVPTFQRSGGSTCALGSSASCSPRAKWSASTAWTWCGAWAHAALRMTQPKSRRDHARRCERLEPLQKAGRRAPAPSSPRVRALPADGQAGGRWGSPVVSPVLFVGQAPGDKEPVSWAKPFAWTAGRKACSSGSPARSASTKRPSATTSTWRPCAAASRQESAKARATACCRPRTTEIENCAPWLDARARDLPARPHHPRRQAGDRAASGEDAPLSVETIRAKRALGGRTTGGVRHRRHSAARIRRARRPGRNHVEPGKTPHEEGAGADRQARRVVQRITLSYGRGVRRGK